MKRVGTSVAIGALIGVVVTIVINSVVYTPFSVSVGWRSYTGFWGAFFGSFAGLTATGVAVALLGRGRLARIGWLFVAVILGLLGAATVWWIVGWGMNLTSLEGVWTYLLAVGCIGAAVWAALKGKARGSLKP